MKPQTKNSSLAGAGEQAKVIPLPAITGNGPDASAKAGTLIITGLLADAVSDTLELKAYLATLIQQGQFTAPRQKHLKVNRRYRSLARRHVFPNSNGRSAIDPEIKIAGQWLYGIGFQPDDYAKIISFHGMIIIFPVADPHAH
ncbi:hypothetical protein [Paraflavitalea speifideaquila]|uniref:hypothetical protein n=1 Tax=Paraflavitalea speifideaquila TaxID=3076558 RepID=UPI0028F114D3|nr:hypothetical protein [Paraflavitalea speifideiaquila]